MPRRDLESSFLRWRDAGDAQALARVFDLAAPELLALARRLCRERAEAEDLLQSTFLVAIERAQAYDGSRRLVPWLVGILVNEARNSRRKRGRDVDRDRLSPSPTSAPDEEAEAREFADALERALETLPKLYRDVLRERLLSDRDSREIALRLDRRPGTVRVQLSRGLEMLRRAMPAMAFSGVFLGLADRRALAAARTRVLARAGIDASVATATVSPALAWIALAIVAGAGIAIGVRSFRSAVDPRPGGSPSDEVAREPRPPASSLAAPGVRDDVAGGDASIHELESILTGRIVDDDGSPLSGVRVEALEADPLALTRDATAWDDGIPSQPRLVVASATTDSVGRFELGGLDPLAFHALAIDAGGELASLRQVEPTLEAGRATDLGELALRSRGPCEGRIVDGDGRPVAGARIRACDLPAVALDLGLADVDPRGAIAFRERDGSFRFVVLPPSGDELLSRLPWPETRSDDAGRFRFSRLPLGATALAVRSKVSATHVVPLDPAARSVAFDAGTIRLDDGVACEGIVVDTAGRPLSGARILCGAIAPLLDAVVLREHGVSDADGRFAIRGLRQAPHLLAALPDGDSATATATSPSLIEFDPLDTGPLQVEVAASASPLELHVQFAPIPGSAGRSSRGEESRSFSGWIEDGGGERTNPLLAPPVRARFEVADGGGSAGPLRVFVANVPSTACRLDLAVEGFGSRTLRLEAGTERPPLEVTFEPERSVEIEVVDAATGAPVRGARVAIARPGFSPRFFLGPYVRRLESTAADGRCVLHDLAAESEPLRVLHPSYSEQSAVIDDGVGRMRIELLRGGVLEGEVDGRDPSSRSDLVVVARSLDRPALPRVALADGTGRFRFQHLAPGDHAVAVLPRSADGSLVRLYLDFVNGTTPLAEAVVAIEDGDTTRAALEVARPIGSAPAETVRGTVLMQGAPAADLLVRGFAANGVSSGRETRTDAMGRFVLEAPGGEVVLIQVREPESLFSQLGRVYATHAIEPGEPREIAIEIAFGTVRGRAVDARSGMPLPFAAVSLRRAGGAGATEPSSSGAIGAVACFAVSDEAGRFEVRNVPAGAYRVKVARSGFCEATRGPLVVAGGGASETGDVGLERAVVVSGVVRGTPVPPDRIGLARDGIATAFATIDSEGRFRLPRVATGENRVVTLSAGGRAGGIVGLDGRVVVVPEAGMTDLVLEPERNP